MAYKKKGNEIEDDDISSIDKEENPQKKRSKAYRNSR